MKSSRTLITEVSALKRSVLICLLLTEGLLREIKANLRGYCQELS